MNAINSDNNFVAAKLQFTLRVGTGLAFVSDSLKNSQIVEVVLVVRSSLIGFLQNLAQTLT